MPFITGYLAQGVGPASTFVENTASGYGRQPVATTELRAASCSLAGPIYHQNGSSLLAVTQRAIFDAPSGGNLLIWWNLNNPVMVAAGAIDRIRAGALSHAFPALLKAGQGANPVDFPAGAQIGTTSDGNPIFSGVAIEVANSILAAALGNAAAGGPTGIFTPVRTIKTGGTVQILANDGMVKIAKTVGSPTPVVLEATPTPGASHTVKDGKGDAAVNPITVSANGGLIDGSTSYVINVNRAAATFTWDSVGNEWTVS